MNLFYKALIEIINEKTGAGFVTKIPAEAGMAEKIFIIPPNRTRYLSEIAETVRNYNKWAEKQAEVAQRLQAIHDTLKILRAKGEEQDDLTGST